MSEPEQEPELEPERREPAPQRAFNPIDLIKIEPPSPDSTTERVATVCTSRFRDWARHTAAHSRSDAQLHKPGAEGSTVGHTIRQT